MKEIHNYVGRLAPHLLGYPRYTTGTSTTTSGAGAGAGAGGEVKVHGQGQRYGYGGGLEVTPMDTALRDLVKGLQPFGLTKGEVLMIVNLGVGVQPPPAAAEEEEQGGEGEQNPDEQITEEGGAEGEAEAEANGTGEQMDVDGSHEVNGVEGAEGAAAEGGEGEGQLAEEDYGALALLDTVIEEREERLSNEDVAQVLKVIRETLGSKEG